MNGLTKHLTLTVAITSREAAFCTQQMRLPPKFTRVAARRGPAVDSAFAPCAQRPA